MKQRREAILGTAVEMLAERPLAEISLRELSDRVGLAKSNVLRYFDSREAVYLEVLDRLWTAWLDDLEPVLEEVSSDAEAVATTVATSLAGHPLLCELISSMAGVLERNVTVEYARVFKSNASRNADRLAAMVRRHFAGSVFVLGLREGLCNQLVGLITRAA